jgi:predicted DNA-binding transcriptional regulator AlpA
MEMTVAQYANMKEVNRITVYKWINKGTLPKDAKVKEVAGRKVIVWRSPKRKSV